jgi:hypothetical protein
VASGRSSNSNSGTNAYDDNTATYWRVASNHIPTSGFVWFDLGSPQTIGSIEWLFAPNSYAGFADGLQIQISNDNQSWTTIASPGGAPPGVWQTLPAGVTARYVRFNFENPAKVRQLGFVAEVRFLP